MTDRESHRAAVEAGYASLAEYIEKWGEDKMDIVEVARDPKNLCQVQGCNTSPTCLCGLIEDMADEIERLREALKPFANVLKGNWSNQSDDMVLNFGFGLDRRLELRLGDFRLARSALQQKESE